MSVSTLPHLPCVCVCVCVCACGARGVSAVPKSHGDNFYRLIINGEVERYAPGQRYVVSAVPKSHGDNFYRLIINGEVERYAPGQRYVVTLVGSRTHDVVQQFTRFKIVLDSLDPGAARAPGKQGQFQLFADTLTRFDEECTNSVLEADDLPKTEVQVMWKAPAAGSGCVLLKAMVFENASRWFAEDGQLTRRVCEDTSLSAPDCCACDDAKYKELVFENASRWFAEDGQLTKRVCEDTSLSAPDCCACDDAKYKELVFENASRWFAEDGQLTRRVCEDTSLSAPDCCACDDAKYKELVFENASRWFAEDGQLTRRVCEDTSLSAPDCCACDDAKYKMVFEGLWSPQTHPKNFPTQALWLTHFSDGGKLRSIVKAQGLWHPRVNANTSATFTVDRKRHLLSLASMFGPSPDWVVGVSGLELCQKDCSWAESKVIDLLPYDAGTDSGISYMGGRLRSIVKAQGLWHPRVNANTSATFTVDRKRHLLSLASMFGPSPDWVVGVSGLELCQKDCSWAESKVIDLLPYDAGTDSGISYMSPNAETNPREKMYRITPMYPEDPRAPFYSPGAAQVPPMARLYLTREALLSRSCDEDVLLAQGLRMRTRQYRMPQKAQMFSCDRQLVSKEMCVAAVPECEGDNAAEAELVSPAGGAEDASGVCGTSAWGVWSECSVTCGVGVSTRRRHFINPMGPKKCPLVQTEDNRKCMEPQCTEEETQAEVSDPTCPTTEWAAWSPCSASCGRGVRGVGPDLPHHRVGRVVAVLGLVRPRRRCMEPQCTEEETQAEVSDPTCPTTEWAAWSPCSASCGRGVGERQDCALDMLTAKRICMEGAEQGPCRGLYQRWTFVAEKGMCVPFNYGGCRGTSNNFLTQEDCMNTCKVILGGVQGAPVPPAVSSNYPGLSVTSIVPIPNSINGPTLASSPDCQYSAWSEWSKCSAISCGIGYQERTRTILEFRQITVIDNRSSIESVDLVLSTYFYF
ncbi:putative f-spondin [Operophtera brumata]|uniref:Spondin-1 n=1 Tax=Operophtera brumata TaxID=104452 RepID=A0A0L7L8U1_OPEBR|nr:putative f-spondin [Operophtera brumata]